MFLLIKVLVELTHENQENFEYLIKVFCIFQSVYLRLYFCLNSFIIKVGNNGLVFTRLKFKAFYISTMFL